MAVKSNSKLFSFIKKLSLPWNFSENYRSESNNSDFLLDIKNNYESIFSWDIHETSAKYRTEGSDFLRKIQQKQDLAMLGGKLKFNFDQFCLGLINCFEIFSNFERSHALSQIKDLICVLRGTQLDEFFDQIWDVCFHIAYVTQAYIMFHMGHDIQKILINVKPKSNFNKAEKSAVYAIKSKIFLEYSPGGNSIALELAESSKNFNDAEMFWIKVWLNAKRRARRFDQTPSLPFRDELEAANKLFTLNNNPELLLSAASVYAEAGSTLRLKPSFINVREAKRFHKLSAELIMKVYNSQVNDVKLLYYCLHSLNNLHPISLIPKNVTDDIVSKLSVVENYKIGNVLGKYFLKIKDYKTARNYFKKSSLSGSFSSSLLLLKVECLIKSVDDFPVVPYLKLLYNSYTCSKKRRCISAQILLYYMYNENDEKELLYCLNTYLNEHINYAQNKNYSYKIYPLYHLKKKIHPKTFVKDFPNTIEQLKSYPNWNSKEKNILSQVVLKVGVLCKLERDKILIHPVMACVVCQDDTANYVLQPCGHQCVCENCWVSLKNINPLLCPMCRTVVDFYLIS